MEREVTFKSINLLDCGISVNPAGELLVRKSSTQFTLRPVTGALKDTYWVEQTNRSGYFWMASMADDELSRVHLEVSQFTHRGKDMRAKVRISRDHFQENTDTISLQLVDYPGYVVRHCNSKLEGAKDDNKPRSSFRSDACFKLIEKKLAMSPAPQAAVLVSAKSSRRSSKMDESVVESEQDTTNTSIISDTKNPHLKRSRKQSNDPIIIEPERKPPSRSPPAKKRMKAPVSEEEDITPSVPPLPVTNIITDTTPSVPPMCDSQPIQSSTIHTQTTQSQQLEEAQASLFKNRVAELETTNMQLLHNLEISNARNRDSVDELESAKTQLLQQIQNEKTRFEESQLGLKNSLRINQNLQTQIDQLTTQLMASEHLNKLASEKDTSPMVKKLSLEILEKDAQIAQLRLEIGNSRQDTSNEQKRIADLQQLLETKNLELSQLQLSHDQAIQTLTSAKDQAQSDLEEKLNILKSNYEKKFLAQSAELDNAINETLDRDSDLLEVRRDLEISKRVVVSLESRVHSVEAELAKSQALLSESQRNLEIATSDHRNSGNVLEQKTAQLSALQANLRTAELQLKEHQQTTKTQIDELWSKNAELKTRVHALAGEKNMWSKEQEILRKKVEQLESADLKFIAADRQAKQLERDLANESFKNRQLLEKVSQLNSDLEDKEREISTLLNKIKRTSNARISENPKTIKSDDQPAQTNSQSFQYTQLKPTSTLNPKPQIITPTQPFVATVPNPITVPVNVALQPVITTTGASKSLRAEPVTFTPTPTVEQSSKPNFTKMEKVSRSPVVPPGLVSASPFRSRVLERMRLRRSNVPEFQRQDSATQPRELLAVQPREETAVIPRDVEAVPKELPLAEEPTSAFLPSMTPGTSEKIRAFERLHSKNTTSSSFLHQLNQQSNHLSHLNLSNVLNPSNLQHHFHHPHHTETDPSPTSSYHPTPTKKLVLRKTEDVLAELGNTPNKENNLNTNMKMNCVSAPVIGSPSDDKDLQALGTDVLANAWRLALHGRPVEWKRGLNRFGDCEFAFGGMKVKCKVIGLNATVNVENANVVLDRFVDKYGPIEFPKKRISITPQSKKNQGFKINPKFKINK